MKGKRRVEREKRKKDNERKNRLGIEDVTKNEGWENRI